MLKTPAFPTEKWMAVLHILAGIRPAGVIGGMLHSVFIAVLLQLTSSVFAAGETILMVICQKQIQNRSARRKDSFAFRTDGHPFFHFRIAGGDHAISPFNFHDTHAA